MQINEKQLAQVNHQIERLLAADNFYGKRLREAGVSHLESAEDFVKLPFSEKQDLREAYPLGLVYAFQQFNSAWLQISSQIIKRVNEGING